MIWEKMGSCVLHLPPTTLSLLRSLIIKLDQKFSSVDKWVSYYLRYLKNSRFGKYLR